MKASTEFFIRGDPLESLFNDDARADSVLTIRLMNGIATVYDGHTTTVRPCAKVLVEKATELIGRRDSVLSPLIHGLEWSGTGCAPTALVVRPRGEAIIMPAAAAEATARQQNPQPILRRHA